MTITEKGNESLPKKVPTIDNIQKTLLQKTIYCPNSIEFRLSELLLNKILERRYTFKKPDLQKWGKEINKMIRIDKRDPIEIEKIINWCQNDNFWQNNILSMSKLREQYDKLALKMAGNPVEVKTQTKCKMCQQLLGVGETRYAHPETGEICTLCDLKLARDKQEINRVGIQAAKGRRL